MKALFNGSCSACHTFKPRCAYVIFKRIVGTGKPTEWLPEAEILCADCREKFRGDFKVDPRHK